MNADPYLAPRGYLFMILAANFIVFSQCCLHLEVSLTIRRRWVDLSLEIMQSTSGDIHPLACFISIAIGPAVLSAPPPSSQDGLKFVLLRSVGDAHLLFAVTEQCATTQMNLTRIEHVRAPVRLRISQTLY